MLRQRLKGEQVAHLLATDQGHDPGVGLPIRLSQGTIVTEYYDEALSKLLDAGEQAGAAYLTVDGCIHLGVHYGQPAGEWRIAVSAAMAGLRATAPEQAVARRAAMRELAITADDGRHSFCSDPYEQGLFAPAVRPFTLWALSPAHRAALMTGRARLATLVDLVGLAALYARHGVALRFTSRREAARYAREGGGGKGLALFDNRALTHAAPLGDVVLMKGTFSRFIYELVRPSTYIAGAIREDARAVLR
jgi:hypothetical protein